MNDARRTLCPSWTVIILVLTLTAACRAADVSPADEATTRRVAARLGAETEPPRDLPWQPRIRVVDKPEANAFASQEWDPKDAGPASVIEVNSGLLRTITRDGPDAPLVEDRLAFVIAHELAHLLLGHTPRPPRAPTRFVRNVFQRDREFQADELGMELVLRAGYRKDLALDAYRKFVELRNAESPAAAMTSLEGSLGDHPSWEDRIARLNPPNSGFYRSLGAFRDGSLLLAAEQYTAAERCFRDVLVQYPDSPSARANLGYALLLRYVDDVSPDELRRRRLGALAVGGFYSRPQVQPGVLLGPPELWTQATGELSAALEKGAGPPARASLGLAYLVAPGGVRLEPARGLFRQAAREIEADPRVAREDRAAVLINAGVAELAGDRPDADAARLYLDRAEALLRADPDAPAGRTEAALIYNRAVLLQDSDPRPAADLFRRYVQSVDVQSSWRCLAYERYRGLCQKLRITADPESALRRVAPLRAATTVLLGDDRSVSLGQSEVAAIAAVGGDPPERLPVVPDDERLMRLRFPGRALDVLSDGQVLAVELRGPEAPPLVLRGQGLGGRRVQLQVGESWDDLRETLRGEGQPAPRLITEVGEEYSYYPRIGLAVRVSEGQVRRLVVVRLPDPLAVLAPAP